MHPLRLWAGACVAWIVPSTAAALEVSAPQAELEARPGTEVVVPFRVAAATGAEVLPEVAFPSGWTAVFTEDPFTLLSTAQTRLVMLRLPEHAPPGRYPVRYVATEGGLTDDAEVEVVVPTVDRLESQVVTAAEMLRPGDAVEFRLVLENPGNVGRDVEVELLPNNVRLDGADGPLAVRVEAGATEARVVQAVVGSDVSPATLVVRVRDVSGVLPAQTVTARVSVVPRNGKVDRMRRLRTAATLWSVSGTNTEGVVGTSVQGELTTEGHLDPGEHLHVDLRLRGPDVDAVSSLARYSHYAGRLSGQFGPIGARVTVGDATYRLTTLTTEQLWGRGASAELFHRRFGVQGLVARDRYRPESPTQWGGAVSVLPGPHRFLLGAHLARLPGRNLITLSQEGFLALLRPTERGRLDLTYEVALSDLAPGAHVDLRGRFPSTAFWVRSTFGAPGFWGTYSDRFDARAGLQQRLGPVRLSPYASANFRGLRDGVAAARRVVQGGMDAEWRIDGFNDTGLTWTHWRLADERAGLRDQQEALEARFWSRSPERTLGGTLGTELRWNDAFDGAAWSVLGSFQGVKDFGRRIQFGGGLRAESNATQRPGGPWVVGGNLSWSLQARDEDLVTAGYAVNYLFGDRKQVGQSLFLSGFVALPWGHAIQWRSTGFLFVGPGRRPGLQFDAQVGYTARFGVPVGRRTDLAIVRGLVKDASTGQALADSPVALDGYTIRTEEDGSFEFLTVPGGEHFLEVPLHDLPPGLSVLPRAQVALGSFGPDDRERVHDFEVVTGGTLRVSVARYGLRDRDYLWTGTQPEFVREAGLAGEVVLLFNGSDVRRAVTEADGTVTFERLVPGDWTVQVRGVPPTDFEFEDPRRVIEVEAKEDAEVEVRLLPRVRTIRYVEVGEPAAEEVPLASQSGDAVVTVRSLQVLPASVVVAPGGEIPVAARLLLSDGRQVDVSADAMWTSENPDVAVPGKGFVVGVAPGSTVIAVELEGRPRQTVSVEVVELPFVGLVAEPTSIALVPGGSTRLTARSIDVDGRFTDVSRKVEWVSEDPEVAVVGTDGTVFAKKEGKTRIRARSFGISAFPVEVTVAPNAYAPIEQPEVTPPTP